MRDIVKSLCSGISMMEEEKTFEKEIIFASESFCLGQMTISFFGDDR